jgi:hypothetical protein
MFYGFAEAADWRAFQHFERVRETLETRRCNTFCESVAESLWTPGDTRVGHDELSRSRTAKTLAMPANDGFRLEDEQGGAPINPNLG